jgi:hypothetical protein
MFTPQKRTVQPEDCFENPAFEQWFEFAKSKRGRRKAALSIFEKQIPPIDSRHQVD